MLPRYLLFSAVPLFLAAKQGGGGGGVGGGGEVAPRQVGVLTIMPFAQQNKTELKQNSSTEPWGGQTELHERQLNGATYEVAWLTPMMGPEISMWPLQP